MMNLDRTEKLLLAGIPILILLGFVLPEWVVNYIQVSLGTGLVALAVMIQMRAGLVSFGQGLYFCIGGYAAGMAGKFMGVSDIFILLIIGMLVSLFMAFIAGFLLRRYREIFFAMLSLALSMILYGLLSKLEVLGSTDGFNIPSPTYLGWAPEGDTAKHALYIATCIPALLCAALLNRYLRSPMGFIGEALRENEIRLEYLGTSAHRAVHIKYMIAATVSGLGGVLWALALGHVDPEMTNWTTSGQFVFISILSGVGNIVAPLFGTFILEIVRVYAVEASPNTWQMILGVIMLLTIIFLPKGLWSLIQRKKASAEETTQK
ncbi:branched-chain amino acid ABC transporter permease [Cocleimonas flava]|jgi:branched-chain amino acid transport system permease protein|uniref:Amino acid/amide ABC transporter membrane protein 2 (HAAT family) n=1 Tax=Cocleimonas flava TaxID=634765 RepID=A0A4R1EPZ5_9GAMM|nr:MULTISPECIES: branched-chain amino acid ABC transporter permease [Cocleimonas]MEB8432675.1 branched-chain amino acid ABC transporter permease [Cocleimonas sp. KMM 6892]MEC4715534.1 branched-chain amino acid ABC transporter permease [Cocleimonas sp. KMM 6895]MEC4744848.1 branched-chain amino acid ABC transporter permease [Cocleimonas sp. KMM 6896]TCJ83103.1 amino acid/amide ABC transporter membrane protein 2 (HAAT family) [Cocleimonas flava]